MEVITGKDNIKLFSWIALHHRLKLEGKGIKFHGPSTLSIAKRRLGLPRSTPRPSVEKVLADHIEKLKKEIK